MIDLSSSNLSSWVVDEADSSLRTAAASLKAVSCCREETSSIAESVNSVRFCVSDWFWDWVSAGGWYTTQSRSDVVTTPIVTVVFDLWFLQGCCEGTIPK